MTRTAAILAVLALSAIASGQRPKLIEITGAIWASADAEAIIEAAKPDPDATPDDPARVVLRFKAPIYGMTWRINCSTGSAGPAPRRWSTSRTARTEPAASTLLAVALASDHAAIAPNAVFSRATDRHRQAARGRPADLGHA